MEVPIITKLSFQGQSSLSQVQCNTKRPVASSSKTMSTSRSYQLADTFLHGNKWRGMKPKKCSFDAICIAFSQDVFSLNV